MRKMITSIAAVLAVSALMVGVASAAEKLAVKGTDGTTTKFYVDETGVAVADKFAAGTTTPQSKIHLNWPSALGVLPAVGTSLYSNSTGFVATTQDNSFAADYTVADGTGTPGYRGTLRGVRSRGTLASPLPPVLDDQVFSLLAGVWSGRVVNNAADISFKVDGTISDGGTQPTTATPIRISFSTRPIGWTWYERLTIKADGKIGISATTPTAVLDVNTDIVRIRTAKTPASATDTCNQGDHAWDANYSYVCVATNTWKRAALTSW